MRLLKKSGFNDIHMCLGHFGDQIENSINNYSISQELSIKYSYDGPRQLGTGGAIKKIINQLPDYFFVTYGDSYLNVDYNEILIFFNKKIKKGDINLMTVYNNKNKWDNSNIIFDGNLITNYSKEKLKPKMNFIDFGLSIISKKSFSQFNKKSIFDLSEYFKYLIKNNSLYGYEVTTRFYEIGSIKGINELNKLL